MNNGQQPFFTVAADNWKLLVFVVFFCHGTCSCTRIMNINHPHAYYLTAGKYQTYFTRAVIVMQLPHAAQNLFALRGITRSMQ
jgi:hypothetical protein